MPLERPNLPENRGGNCGASFRSGLPQSDSDSDGVYVMGLSSSAKLWGVLL